MENSKIKEFFKNQTIFLTGGTGFLGKVILEKLLRECDHISKIYLLVRPKKEKSPEERFSELLELPCFERIRSKKDVIFKKVQLVNGDCYGRLLGLNDQDIAILKKETTCVIHCAANVKFDQSLKEAAYFVRATRDLLELAKLMTNLKSFVYVSTAYTNCVRSEIKEEFYDPPLTSERLFCIVNSLSEDILKEITPLLLGEWPNTYVYSKNIIESLVQEAGKTLPISVVRPSIVGSASSEPIPGWIDNFYGPTGAAAGILLGVIRTLRIDLGAPTQVVPVDFVCNCILAVAWKTPRNTKTTIYNFVGENHLSWRESLNEVIRQFWKIPTIKLVWYYGLTVTKNKTWSKVYVLFLHTIPAYVADFVLYSTGRETLAVKKCRRLNTQLDLMSYFSTRTWHFETRNVEGLWQEMSQEDKNLFNFNFENFDWRGFLREGVYGGRRFLLKESLDTVPQAKRRLKILFVAHYTLQIVFFLLLFKLLGYILNFFI